MGLGERSQCRCRRFVTVLLHEVGHSFYLDHCVSFDCLVNGSNQESELDAQALDICPECHSKLFDLLRFDPMERFGALQKVFRELNWTREASFASNMWLRLRER